MTLIELFEASKSNLTNESRGYNLPCSLSYPFTFILLVHHLLLVSYFFHPFILMLYAKGRMGITRIQALHLTYLLLLPLDCVTWVLWPALFKDVLENKGCLLGVIGIVVSLSYPQPYLIVGLLVMPVADWLPYWDYKRVFFLIGKGSKLLCEFFSLFTQHPGWMVGGGGRGGINYSFTALACLK